MRPIYCDACSKELDRDDDEAWELRTVAGTEDEKWVVCKACCKENDERRGLSVEEE